MSSHQVINLPRISNSNTPASAVLTKEEKSRKFQEQWLGHLFAKLFALVVNTIALGTAFWYWEFGSEWEKVINLGLFGTIPVHIMCIFITSVATKYGREMSMIHDYLCIAACFMVAIIFYFVLESETPTALFMSITGIMLAFDLAIHIFTERNQ